MKNQTDLIVMIVSGVLAIGAAAAMYFTKPQPVIPAQPAAINVKAAELPAGDVKMASSLPNAGSGGGTAAGGGPRGGGRGAAPTGLSGGGAPPPSSGGMNVSSSNMKAGTG